MHPTTELYYDFLINTNSARYNRFHHDFSTADPSLAIKHINDGIMDTVVYTQSFHGVTAKVRFPGLEAYKSLMPLSVNKARLIYHVNLDGVYFTPSKVPSQIYLDYVDTAGYRRDVPDYSIYATFFGGAFNSTSLTYSFNLAAFVQDYLKGVIPKAELEMYLPEGESRNAMLRNIGSTAPPTFTFVYTRF